MCFAFRCVAGPLGLGLQRFCYFIALFYHVCCSAGASQPPPPRRSDRTDSALYINATDTRCTHRAGADALSARGATAFFADRPERLAAEEVEARIAHGVRAWVAKNVAMVAGCGGRGGERSEF